MAIIYNNIINLLLTYALSLGYPIPYVLYDWKMHSGYCVLA